MTSSRKSGRTLSAEERALWHDIARSIKPIRRKRKDALTPGETPDSVKAQPITKKLLVAPPPPPKANISVPPAKIDRRTKRKLARGKEAIEARLDLHGMTQAQAHNALTRFLLAAQAEGARYVLVVTGKGSGSGARGGVERGILRQQVPHWLETGKLREVVLGFDAANIGHGGEGALYVRLRRASVTR
jgi:DNA-nicking Smr family endonuclease